LTPDGGRVIPFGDQIPGPHPSLAAALRLSRDQGAVDSLRRRGGLSGLALLRKLDPLSWLLGNSRSFLGTHLQYRGAWESSCATTRAVAREGGGPNVNAHELRFAGVQPHTCQLTRCQHHHDLAALKASVLLDLGELGGVVLDPIEKLVTQFLMRQLAPAEAKRHFHLVAFFEEALH